MPSGSPEAFKTISARELQKIADGRIGVWVADKLKIRDSTYAQRQVALEILESIKEDRKPKMSVRRRAENIIRSQKEITIKGIRDAMGIMKGTPEYNGLRGRLSEMAKAGIIERVSRGVYRF